METLLLFSDILMCQEHFLLGGDKKHKNTNKIIKKFGNQCDMYIVPAIKDNNQIKRGRGSGGLVTMWHKKLTRYVSKIPSDNNRLQFTKFSFPSGALLLCNLYNFCDPGHDFDDTDLRSTLNEISTKIKDSKCQAILLGGDYNTDFTRQTMFVKIMKDFLDSIGLMVFSCNPVSQPGHMIHHVDYTHKQYNKGALHTSYVDHFSSSKRVYDSVIEYNVVHSGQNTSDHEPIYVKLNVGELEVTLENITKPAVPSWTKATENDRNSCINTMAELLDSISIPDCVKCVKTSCTQHNEQIEDYCLEVLEAIEKSAKTSLPATTTSSSKTKNKRHNIPGFNEFVRPLKEESIFYHSLWLSAGKPKDGQLFVSMRDSHYQYKYAARKLKRASDSLKKDLFVQSLANGGKDIFDEVKKFRGKVNTCSGTVDGEVGAKNIAQHFANKYSKLYSKVTLDKEFEKLCDQINVMADQSDVSTVEKINDQLVRDGLNHLKGNKKDSLFSFTSDLLINGPPILISHLTNMFRMFLVHGRVATFMLICTLLPLVKDNLGDLASSDNYRGIAIGSLVLKLFDWIILLLEGPNLSCDELQFSYQKMASTTMCTWAISAVIEHYNNQGREIYGCAADISKAFDMCSWIHLFKELVKREVSPLVLRVLLFIYVNQSCDVLWNGKYSERFGVTNGVRQGAVTSCILFCVYLDILIKKLRFSGIGCHVAGKFMGIFVYADDIFLISPSRSGLQAMLSECEEYAEKFNFTFSTNIDPVKSKTKCIIFSSKENTRIGIDKIKLNGTPLPWENEVNHLGNLLQSENNFKVDCALKRGKFIGKVHTLIQEFHFISAESMTELIKIYTTSFYSSSLWDLFSSQCERIFTSWNITVRMIFKIPPQSHNYFIESLSNCLHVKVMLASRFMQFHKSLLENKKSCIRLLSNICVGDQRTIHGRNIFNLQRVLDCDMDDLSSSFIKENLKFKPLPEQEQWRVPLLLNLLDIRNNSMVLDNFEKEEIEDMIKQICIN